MPADNRATPRPTLKATTAPTLPRTTRRSDPLHTPPEELQREARKAYPTPEHAREHLAHLGYLVDDTPLSMTTISQTLLLLAQSATSKILTEGVKAVAIIIDSESVAKTGTDIARAIIDRIKPTIQKLESAAEDIQANTTMLHKKAERQYNTFEEMRDEMQTTNEQLKDALQKNAENTNVVPPQTLLTHTLGTAGNNTMSYAAALNNNLPISHRNTIARNVTREKQVLMDVDTDAQDSGIMKLTEMELVVKANEALKIMGEDWPSAKETRAVGAKRLRNGGIVYEFTTAEGARFVREEREEFIGCMGESATIKDRVITVLAEYVPVSHKTDEDFDLKKIEGETAGLKWGDLVQTRWVKPVTRRTPNQQTAHLIVRFSNTTAANLAIRDGMIISGKRVWARKMKKEPRRCLKCQKINANHFAAECKEEKDTCGTCGGEHRTTICSLTTTSLFKCTNCNTNGHATWDRNCPIFKAECNKLDNTDNENTYRFFPNNEPWTWEQQEGHSNFRGRQEDGPETNRRMDHQNQYEQQWRNDQQQKNPRRNSSQNSDRRNPRNQSGRSSQAEDATHHPQPQTQQMQQTTITQYSSNQNNSGAQAAPGVRVAQ